MLPGRAPGSGDARGLGFTVPRGACRVVGAALRSLLSDGSKLKRAACALMASELPRLTHAALWLQDTAHVCCGRLWLLGPPVLHPQRGLRHGQGQQFPVTSAPSAEMSTRGQRPTRPQCYSGAPLPSQTPCMVSRILCFE